MKKNSKILMRFFASGLMMLTLIFYSYSSYAQSSGLTLDEKMTSLKQVIEKVEKISGYNFLYNAQLVDVSKKVSISKKNVELRVILNELFKGTDITYKVVDKQIVLSPKDFSSEKNSTQGESTRGASSLNGVDKNTKQIKGKILDEAGRPIPGATILVKGTTLATSTNIDGFFTIAVPEGRKNLTVSFVGYTSVVFSLTTSDTYQLILKSDAKRLDEVVVTGYQSIAKERTTGSFVTMKKDELVLKPSMNFIEKLAGTVSGVNYTKGKIEIRGQSTLMANQAPLFVVDGFPIESDLLSVNQDDIETITILKDASAASIWGVKASNGVVVITTKSGKSEQPIQVNLSTYYAIEEKIDYSKMNWLTPEQEIDLDLEYNDKGWHNWSSEISKHNPFSLLDEAYIKRKGFAPDGSKMTEKEFSDYVSLLKKKDMTKQWEDLMIRNSVNKAYNLSINGGNKNNKYYASLVYNDNLDASVGNSNNRIMLSINDRYKLNKYVDVFTVLSTGLRSSKNNGIGIGQPLFEQPYNDLVDENGQPIQYYNRFNRWSSQNREKIAGSMPYSENWIDERNNKNSTSKIFNSRVQFGISVQPLKGLKIESKFQYERNYTNQVDISTIDLPSFRNTLNDLFIPVSGKMTYQLPLGSGYYTNNTVQYAWDWRNTFSYDFAIKQHHISLFGGTEVRKRAWENTWNKNYGYDAQTTSYVPVNNLGFTSGVNTWYGTKYRDTFFDVNNTDDREVSMFANGAYTFRSRYTLSGSFRIDQKNLFGSDPNFRYKPLWSTGIAWNLSKEDFMKELSFVNLLNLKFSYGINGNASNEYSPYPQATSSITTRGSKIFNLLAMSNPANPQLKWEETAITNFSAEFGLFDNRISGIIEGYVRNSSDLLGSRNIDPTNGFGSAIVNYASVQNKGLEITLNCNVLKKEDLTVDIRGNFSYNHNKITKIDNAINTAQYVAWKGITQVGKPISNLYSYNFAGLSNTGDVQLYDGNGSVKSWRQGVVNQEELIYWGTRVAPYYGGFGAAVRYKDFDLNLSGSFKFGNYYKNYTSVGSSGFGIKGTRMDESWANRWRKPGDELTTDVPKIAYEGINPLTGKPESRFDNGQADQYWQDSQKFVEKGGFVRINDITVGYNLNSKYLKFLHLSNLRLTAQISNPFLWVQNRFGLDPESYSSPAFDNLKRFTFGVNMTF